MYKFYVNQNDAYFYIDYRDSNYTTEYSNCGGHCADTWIKYDANNDEFAYISDASDAHDPNDGDWIDITNGDILYIWEIKEQSTPNTKGFPSFWSKCLYILDDYNNPRLTWGAHPTFTTTNFKIYRASSSTPVSKPITLNYSLIGTVSSSTYEFIDGDIRFGQIDYIYYYIKAYNSSSQTYSGLSNIVDIRGGFYKSNSTNHVSNNTTSCLYQNHPNPFNPSTNIFYHLPENGHVTLKVYDMLGREIAELVNSTKAPGRYEVQFDGSNLASGTYIYQINVTALGEGTEGYSASKKMLLIK